MPVTSKFLLVTAIALSSFWYEGNAQVADQVSAQDAIGHVGKYAVVCGKVASANFAKASSGQPTFLNLDAPFPNHIFTAVVFGRDRQKFDYRIESLKGKDICVSGTIEMYRGKPEIEVTSPSQISLSSD